MAIASAPRAPARTEGYAAAPAASRPIGTRPLTRWSPGPTPAAGWKKLSSAMCSITAAVARKNRRCSRSRCRMPGEGVVAVACVTRGRVVVMS